MTKQTNDDATKKKLPRNEKLDNTKRLRSRHEERKPTTRRLFDATKSDFRFCPLSDTIVKAATKAEPDLHFNGTTHAYLDKTSIQVNKYL